MVTKTATLEKNQAATLVKKYFDHFQTVLNTPNSNPSDLEKYLSRHFHMTSNGHTIAKSFQDYLNRVEKFRKKYSRFDISELHEEPIISGNRAVFNYDIHLTSRNGQRSEVNIMAIGTIEDNKITHWTQVAHEKGTDHWDS